MIPVQPDYMPQPFANGGEKNVIPNSGGEVLGNASYASGFPQITETPIELGGVPPQRKDFNGILNALSMFAFYAQSGGVYEYSATANYDTPAFVIYKNVFYFCLQQNGIDSANGVKAPTDRAYWVPLLDYMLEYSATANYDTPAVVIYNNIFYFCLQQNGVDSVNGVKAPTNTAYWIPLIDYLLEGLSVGTPIGTIIMWASSTNPQDGGVWLDCNGQSCTSYPKLVAIVGNNVPDLQGLFPRCIGSQTVAGTTYSASLGDKQGDAIRNITGYFSSEAQPGGLSGTAEYGGAFDLSSTGRGHVSGNIGENNNNYSFDASRVVPIAYENRPAYVGLRFLIKAQ